MFTNIKINSVFKTETYTFVLKVLLLGLGFVLIITRTWVGEDAFIFFRYVDNFVNGQGLVFNMSERVEGFTAPLWVFVLSLLRFTTSLELRLIAIILGLLISTLSIGFLLFFANNRRVIFPIGVILLITNSAFRDFATSGFETSLTYLLVILFGLLIKDGFPTQYPFRFGLVLSLLILNRPESMLVFVYILSIFILSFSIKFVHRNKQYSLITEVKHLLLFLGPFLILVVGYQIFRLNYYHEFFPNTFYAKRGGELYLSQGFNYIKDFFLSYIYSIIAIGLLCLHIVFTSIKQYKKTKRIDHRVHLILIAMLLISYVLYSGGDYMHGRSLLVAYILLCVAVNDVLDAYTGKNLFLGFVIFFLLFLIFFEQKPYPIYFGKEVNNIGDQRTQFSLGFKLKDIKWYMSQSITEEFGWKASGLYYKEITEKIGMPISVVYYNIGFFGYAAGNNVNVLGGSLIDPYLAHLPLEKRGKIGHEDSPPSEYVLARRPTFAYTPFIEWNRTAQFRYEEAPHADIIVGDANGSFQPVFDISDTEFINKFSKLIQKDVKKEIDGGQRKYLSRLTARSLASSYDYTNEYMGFLRLYWYPYANTKDKLLFEEKFKLLNKDRSLSKYEQFMSEDYIEAKKKWEPIGSLIINK